MSNFEPGGDAKAITRIAQGRYGGYEQMFEHHGLPERGSDMMRKVQTRVKDYYGISLRFVEHHERSA